MPDAAAGDAPNKPSNSAFKQQRLKAWQPILTPRPVIAFFIAIGLLFIPLGIVFYSASNNTYEEIVQYDTLCPSSIDGNATAAFCKVPIDVKEDLDGPVYLYYRLTNYYQNHRRYVKSRSDAQLRGERLDYDAVATDCDPIVSKDGSTAAEDVYFPCGLVAWSMFNDTFRFESDVELNEKGIAWPSDLERKFGAPQGVNASTATPVASSGPLARFDTLDEHFIVWMRTAALPDFRKLYGRIDGGLKKGTYTVLVSSTYDVSSFNGTKSIVLATTSWLGGKNPFLGIAYIVVGAVSLFIGIAFLVKHTVSPRKMGDTSYLRWSR